MWPWSRAPPPPAPLPPPVASLLKSLNISLPHIESFGAHGVEVFGIMAAAIILLTFRHHFSLGSSMERRKQTLAVFTFSLYLLPPLIVLSLTLVYKMLTAHAVTAALASVYLLWAYFVDSSATLGRRPWLRRSTWWHAYADYFPLTLVKTAPLNPEGKYVFGYHPHGAAQRRMHSATFHTCSHAASPLSTWACACRHHLGRRVWRVCHRRCADSRPDGRRAQHRSDDRRPPAAAKPRRHRRAARAPWIFVALPGH